MPDGVYERDIPGYNDIEVDILFMCEGTDLCGEWEEAGVTVDSSGGHDVEAVCPTCGELVTQEYSAPEIDYDPPEPDYNYDGPY